VCAEWTQQQGSHLLVDAFLLHGMRQRESA
jgi:hypothetical protein